MKIAYWTIKVDWSNIIQPSKITFFEQIHDMHGQYRYFEDADGSSLVRPKSLFFVRHVKFKL